MARVNFREIREDLAASYATFESCVSSMPGVSHGVGYLEHERWTPPEPLPVMLLVNDEDYLIADDFEVDVPGFEHSLNGS